MEFSEQFPLLKKRPNHCQHAKRFTVTRQAADKCYPLLLEESINRKIQRGSVLDFLTRVEQCAPVLAVCASGKQFVHLLNNSEPRLSIARIHQPLMEPVVSAPLRCLTNFADIRAKILGKGVLQERCKVCRITAGRQSVQLGKFERQGDDIYRALFLEHDGHSAIDPPVTVQREIIQAQGLSLWPERTVKQERS